ncbi:hypothetical protein OH807_35830 [Kitasatospora sp. NBC_01560]|uniref:hypothetical protein n=1 Tax=Kitasatospora sp. NBC_01560 TaxID=2975965 RepID=UPI003868BD09
MAAPQSYPWENMLRAFAGTDHSTITDRDAVVSQKWITGHMLTTTLKSINDKRKVKGKVNGDAVAGYDMWAEWVYPAGSGQAQYSTLLGVTCNWPFWDDPGTGEKDSPLGSFGHAADEVLGKLLWGSALANDKTSEASFTAAVASIRQLEKWITDQQVKLRDWADGVDGAGSDFQGSAAGRLKEVLVGLRGEFDEVQIRLGGTGDLIAKQLETARDALHTAVLSLYDKGYNAWGGKPTYAGTGQWILQPESQKDNPESWRWPHACVRYAFAIGVAQLTPTLNANKSSATFAVATATDGTPFQTGILVPPTDMAGDGFIDWLETTAVNRWKSWVVEKLDKAATDANAVLTPIYNTTSGYLGTFAPPTITLQIEPPKPGPEAPPPPGGAGGTGDKGPDLGTGDKGGGPPPPKTDIGPPPPVKGDLGGIGGNKGNTGGIGGIGGIGGGGGGQAPLLDKNGKPLLDKNGQPLMVPPGTRVNAKGELIGPDGKPLLGTDGKPRHVPAGTTVGQPAATGNGNVFKVPVGSKVNDDGTVTGPDGAKLIDANGNPVVLGKGSTIDKDGVVRDQAGRPVSPLEQLLSDEEQALAARRGSTGGVFTGGGGTGGVYTGGGGTGGVYTGLPSSLGGLGDGFGTGRTSGVRGTGTDLFGESFGGGSGVRTTGGIAASGPASLGVGEKMASTLGLPKSTAAMAEEAAATRGAAQRAAAATAAEEAELMGRQVSTTGGAGSPMMPPMGGAGAGAAGGQGEKDRQRTTWLAEDEEVWGTDTGGVTGVIGR